MFSFHKPKIYRSISGCCICKAKSSSSRFTDSKKYEAEFERCFHILAEKRSGEICNACVLLVKRWKKLPAGTQRDWRHVVDARAGPGTKSLKNAKLTGGSQNGAHHHNHSSTISGGSMSASHSHKKVQKPKRVKGTSSAEMADDGEVDSNLIGGPDSLTEMSTLGLESDSSDDGEEEDDDYLSDYDDQRASEVKRKLRSRNTSNAGKALSHNSNNNTSKHSSSLSSSSSKRPNLNSQCDVASPISSFLDMSFWRKEKICCGIIFKGPDNEVLLYPKLLKPCTCRRNAALQAKVNGSASSDSSSVSSTSPLEEDANSNASSSNIFNI